MFIRAGKRTNGAKSLLIRLVIMAILLLFVFLLNYTQGSSIQETSLNILFKLDPMDAVSKWKVVKTLGLEDDPNINPFAYLEPHDFQWTDRQQELMEKWRQWMHSWSAPGAIPAITDLEPIFLSPVLGYLLLSLFVGLIAGHSVTWLEDEIEYRIKESNTRLYRCLRWILQLGLMVVIDIFMLACMIPILSWPYLFVATLPLDILGLLALLAPWLYPIGGLILLCGLLYLVLRFYLLKPENLVLLSFFLGLKATGVILDVWIYLLYILLLHLAVRGLNFALEEFDLDDPDTIFERIKTSAISGGILFGIACGIATALQWFQAQL